MDSPRYQQGNTAPQGTGATSPTYYSTIPSVGNGGTTYSFPMSSSNSRQTAPSPRSHSPSPGTQPSARPPLHNTLPPGTITFTAQPPAGTQTGPATAHNTAPQNWPGSPPPPYPTMNATAPNTPSASAAGSAYGNAKVQRPSSPKIPPSHASAGAPAGQASTSSQPTFQRGPPPSRAQNITQHSAPNRQPENDDNRDAYSDVDSCMDLGFGPGGTVTTGSVVNDGVPYAPSPIMGLCGTITTPPPSLPPPPRGPQSLNIPPPPGGVVGPQGAGSGSGSYSPPAPPNFTRSTEISKEDLWTGLKKVAGDTDLNTCTCGLHNGKLEFTYPVSVVPETEDVLQVVGHYAKGELAVSFVKDRYLVVAAKHDAKRPFYRTEVMLPVKKTGPAMVTAAGAGFTDDEIALCCALYKLCTTKFKGAAVDEFSIKEELIGLGVEVFSPPSDSDDESDSDSDDSDDSDGIEISVERELEPEAKIKGGSPSSSKKRSKDSKDSVDKSKKDKRKDTDTTKDSDASPTVEGSKERSSSSKKKKLTKEEKKKIKLQKQKLARKKPLDEKKMWATVAGYDGVKAAMKQCIILPLTHPELFAQMATLTRGNDKRASLMAKAVLLTGPPGVGKTTITRVAAHAARVPLVYVPVESVMSKWYGEAEQRLRAVFDLTRRLGKAVMFLDELDTFAGSRDGGMHEVTRRILSVLLRQLDGLDLEANTQSDSKKDKKKKKKKSKSKSKTKEKKNSKRNSSQKSLDEEKSSEDEKSDEDGGDPFIITIGATNRPSDLDAALVSRFDQSIHFPLPSLTERGAIFNNYAQALGGTDHDLLGRESEGFSGRDIVESCKMAERLWLYRLLQERPDCSRKQLTPPPLSIYLEAVRHRSHVQTMNSLNF